MELLVSKYKCLQQRKMVSKPPLLRFCFYIPRVFKNSMCEGRSLGAEKCRVVETVVIVIVFQVYRIH